MHCHLINWFSCAPSIALLANIFFPFSISIFCKKTGFLVVLRRCFALRHSWWRLQAHLTFCPFLHSACHNRHKHNRCNCTSVTSVKLNKFLSLFPQVSILSPESACLIFLLLVIISDVCCWDHSSRQVSTKWAPVLHHQVTLECLQLCLQLFLL